MCPCPRACWPWQYGCCVRSTPPGGSLLVDNALTYLHLAPLEVCVPHRLADETEAGGIYIPVLVWDSITLQSLSFRDTSSHHEVHHRSRCPRGFRRSRLRLWLLSPWGLLWPWLLWRQRVRTLILFSERAFFQLLLFTFYSECKILSMPCILTVRHLFLHHCH